MVDVFAVRTFLPGQPLMREGEAGDHAFMIEHGRVEISTCRDGRTVVLNTLGQGAIVGEMALIDGSPRMATVTAVEKTIALTIDRRVFDRVLSEADPVLRALVHSYTSHLRKLAARMAQRPAG
jgi:CRP-like cAMP-binding protein